MSRKSLLLALGVLLLLTGGTGGTLALLVRHEPEFYRKAAVAPGEDRKKLSKNFQTQFGYMMTYIINYEDKKWDAEFTEEQINSYLEEDFLRSGITGKSFPEGISEPRVAIEDGKFRLAFRYGKPPWSTVVSFDVRCWLAAKEPNVVALRLEGRSAGLLPFSAQSILDSFFDTLRRQDVEVTWYRHEGKPVALLRFQPGRKTATVQLRQLKLVPGRIVIGMGVSGGRPPTDEPSNRAMLTPPPDALRSSEN